MVIVDDKRMAVPDRRMPMRVAVWLWSLPALVFVVMMLNLGEEARKRERAMLDFSNWLLPGLLALVLLAELLYVLLALQPEVTAQSVLPKQVGLSLFGPGSQEWCSERNLELLTSS